VIHFEWAGMLVGLAALALGTAAGAMPEIIAHRGASAVAPENTLAAVRAAWRLQADAVEVDVHLTRDGHIVVMHDGSTGRTAGVDLTIAESTLAELQALDVGKWKGARWTGERIPTLEQVLAAVPRGKRLFIEIKSGPALVPALVRALRGAPEVRVAIISFNAEAIQAAKRKLPQVPTYWLCSAVPGATALIPRARGINANGLDVQASAEVEAGFVRALRAAGMGLYVWTVDDPATARRLATLGVDGITTNVPDVIRQALEAK